MSSILLKKDHDGKKAGTVISVPFGLGKLLIEQGVGIYPDQAGQQPQVTTSFGGPVVNIPSMEFKGGQPKKAEPAGMPEPPQNQPPNQPKHQAPIPNDNGKHK